MKYLKQGIGIVLGIALGAVGVYFLTDSNQSESAAVDGAQYQSAGTAHEDTDGLQHATGDDRESLVETVAFQVAAERGLDFPTDAIRQEVEANLLQLEAVYPDETAADFREAYRILTPARLYFPDLTLNALRNMLVDEAAESKGDVRHAAEDLYDHLQYEYFRRPVDEMQARSRHEEQLNETIQANLAAMRERGQAANARRQAAFENLGRRTPVQRHWVNDYLATIRIPQVRVPNARINEGRVPNARIPNVRIREGRVPEVRVPENRIREGNVPGVRPVNPR